MTRRKPLVASSLGHYEQDLLLGWASSYNATTSKLTHDHLHISPRSLCRPQYNSIGVKAAAGPNDNFIIDCAAYSSFPLKNPGKVDKK